jgi:hypothetical protein
MPTRMTEIDSFQNCMNDMFASFNRWLKVNKLAFNFDKINFMISYTDIKTCFNLNIRYDDKTIEEAEKNKFLSLQIDSTLNWKTYSLNGIVHQAQHALLRGQFHHSKTETLKLVYFPYFHSITAFFLY